MEFSSLLWIFLVLLILRAIYRYLTKPYKYWEERGVPSASSHPIIGSLFPSFTRPEQDVLVERYKKYGRIFGYYESSRPLLVVGDPGLLKEIFVKEFLTFPGRRGVAGGDPVIDNMVSVLKGESWKRVRTIITPAFTTGKIKKMFSIMLDSAKTLGSNLEEYAKTGTPIDAKRLFGAFTMDVIASSAFATKIDSHNDPENPFAVAARRNFGTGIRLRFILFFLFPGLFKFFGINVFTNKSTEFFRNATLQIIEERKRTGKTQNDFLQLLIDSSDEAVRGSKATSEVDAADEHEEKNLTDMGHEEANSHMFKPSNYKGLNSDEIVANCVIFFLAGYDTTASTLSFASYLLALNPSCQETLISEIDDALRQNNGQLSYESVQNMKYLDNVISETLRVYSPAVVTNRQAETDFKLGDTGITIPKGMIVTIPVYAIHRDAEFYPEPEKFDPNRFSPEEKSRRDPYTFLAFGAGPRNCIGMRFALIEIKICLAHLFSQFRVKRCQETMVPLEFHKGQQLLQPKEIKLLLVKRDDKVC